MKTKLLFFLLLAYYSLHAGDFRGGDIRIQQHTALSVQVYINVNLIIHSEIENITVCWGDGSCDILGNPQVLENPGIDTKTLYFFWTHQYNQFGYYEVTVEECCWANDIFNMNLMNEIPFKLEAHFELINPQVDTFNIMPYSQSLPLTEGMFNQLLVYNSLVNILAGDECTFEICEVDVPNYFTIDEIFNQPNNFFFDDLTGGFTWFSPPSSGYFIVKVCLTTTRGGQIISETSRDILIAIQDPVSVENTDKNDALNIKCIPNPAYDFVQLTYQLNQMSVVKISLFDPLGRIVKLENQGIQPEGNHTYSIDIQHLTTGTYFVKIQTERKTEVVSFLKNRL